MLGVFISSEESSRVESNMVDSGISLKRITRGTTQEIFHLVPL